MRNDLKTLSGTTSDSGGTEVLATVRGLGKYDWFQIDAALVGGTGDTIDVVLQREVSTGVWRDWMRFPQLADGASAIYYSATVQSTSDITVVGTMNAAATVGAVALAANTSVGGHPGDAVRLLVVGGGSMTAGATQTVLIRAWQRHI